jgi:hypothetical protein
MPGFDFAIDSQSKDFWQSKCRSDMKAGACHRQVIDGARHFSRSRTIFDDATPMRGDPLIFSAINHRLD